MALVIRKTQIISVEEYLKIDVMDFSQIRFVHPLKPETGRALDVGSIAYSKRQKTKSINRNHLYMPNLVDLSSFRKERLFFLSNLNHELINKRSATHNVFFRGILRVFDWFDNNNYENCFASPENLNKAYFAYTNYLFERLLTEAHAEPIKARVAKDYQWMCRKIIALAFPEQLELITAGVRAIKGKSEEAIPISNQYIKEYWEVNYEIFKKFTKQCFDNKAFPPLIKTRRINSYYFPFPQKGKRLNSVHIDVSKHLNRKDDLEYFDLNTGNFLFVSSCEHNVGVSNFYNKKSWRNYCSIKQNKRHKKRLEMAVRAKQAFIQLFRILTRINGSDLMRLEYQIEYEIRRNKTSQEFYSIKYRAGGKAITCRLEKGGYGLFKEYLKLRKWLLNGKKCEYLFFSLGKVDFPKPKMLGRQTTDAFHNFLRKQGFVSYKAKALKDQEIRNTNSIFLRNAGYSSKSVADNNNHTVESSESFYSINSIEKQAQELGLYWQAIANAEQQISLNGDIEYQSIPSGSCSKNEKVPKSITPKPTITPNCKTAQGCLFCVYYVCHADTEDIRKLLSLLFVSVKLVEQANDIEFSDSIYNSLIIRIEYILAKVSTLSSQHYERVKTIKSEVFEDGLITVFWDKRLDYYTDMGLLNL